jgi:hypothetical protein
MIAFLALMLGVAIGLPIGAALGSDLGRHGKVEVIAPRMPVVKLHRATAWRRGWRA